MVYGSHSLKHVSVWDYELGWIHIEPEEAANRFKQGISYSEKVFFCEACGKYVTLARGWVNIPYFTHSNADAHYCIDKISSVLTYRQYNILGFSLPLKVLIAEGHDIEALIGFLPLPAELFADMEKRNATVEIRAKYADGKPLVPPLLINRERFSERTCTYYSIGQNVAEQYKLTFTQENADLQRLWPSLVEGIARTGTLFDMKGFRLPNDGDVEVGCEYTLIKICNYLRTPKEIYKTREIRLNNGWYAYTIVAETFCQSAANFFIEYGARLTESPTKFIPIWPPVVRYSHVVQHEANNVYLCLHGEGYIEHYLRQATCRQIKVRDEHSLVSISTDSVQQLLSISRASWQAAVLGYLLLKKQQFAPRKHIDDVSVKDGAGNELLESSITAAPNGGLLVVKAPMDGHLDILVNEKLVGRYEIFGDKAFVLNGINLGCRVAIYQGLDRVREFYFARPQKSIERPTEADLLRKLQCRKGKQILIGHAFARYAVKLEHYPTIKRWLLKRIRDGYVYEDALAILHLMLKGERI